MRFLMVRPYADFAVADVANGISNGLTANGHEVVDYMLSRRLRWAHIALKGSNPRAEVNTADAALMASEAVLYKAITEECPWLIVICGGWVHPNALVAFRAIGGKVAVVLTEGPYDTNNDGELRLLKAADVAFTNERTCVKLVQDALDAAGNGGKGYYLPHSYDPTVHNANKPIVPLDDDEKNIDVLFFGTGFTERQRLLEGIDWTGINVAFGGNWPGMVMYGNQHLLHKYLKWPCIDNKDLARLYHGCKIVLNLHRWAEGAYSLNPRAYETAACGAFQICDGSRPELQDVFGNSVPTFDYGVPWRLEAEIRKWLADDVGRARLAKEARKRVQECSFVNRTRFIVDKLEEYEASRRATTQAVA